MEFSGAKMPTHFRPYRAAKATSTIGMTALPQTRAITVVENDQPRMVIVAAAGDRNDRGVDCSAATVHPVALLCCIQIVIAGR